MNPWLLLPAALLGYTVGWWDHKRLQQSEASLWTIEPEVDSCRKCGSTNVTRHGYYSEDPLHCEDCGYCPQLSCQRDVEYDQF